MAKPDPLIPLIQSLSKSEKRHFRVMAQKESKLYVGLFNALSKINNPTDKSILKQFKNMPFARDLSRRKNKLYDLILKSLRIYHSKHSANGQIRNMMTDFENLRQKALYGQALHSLAKAKKLAGLSGNFHLMLEALNYESLYKHGWYDQNLFSDQLNTLDKLGVIYRYERLLYQMQVFYEKEEYARSADRRKHLKQLADDPLIEKEPLTESVQALCYHHLFKALYYNSTGDFIKSYGHNRKVLELSEPIVSGYINPVFQGIHRMATLNLIACCCKLGKIREAHSLVNALPSFERLSRHAVLVYFLPGHNSILDLNIQAGTFENGLRHFQTKLQPVMGQLYSAKGWSINNYKPILYFNLCIIFFGLKQFKNALMWLNRMFNETEQAHKTDLSSIARILNLILVQEMSKSDMEFLTERNERYVIDNNRFNGFEKLMIDFVKSKGNLPARERQAPVLFKRLKRNILRQISPGEMRIIGHYFDFMSWIESKISGRSFAEVVREKAARLSRRAYP